MSCVSPYFDAECGRSSFAYCVGLGDGLPHLLGIPKARRPRRHRRARRLQMSQPLPCVLVPSDLHEMCRRALLCRRMLLSPRPLAIRRLSPAAFIQMAGLRLPHKSSWETAVRTSWTSSQLRLRQLWAVSSAEQAHGLATENHALTLSQPAPAGDLRHRPASAVAALPRRGRLLKLAVKRPRCKPLSLFLLDDMAVCRIRRFLHHGAAARARQRKRRLSPGCRGDDGGASGTRRLDRRSSCTAGNCLVEEAFDVGEAAGERLNWLCRLWRALSARPLLPHPSALRGKSGLA